MSADRIEREVLIAAPLERVWSLVAQPGFWVADKASLPGTVANEGETLIAKNPEHGDFPVHAPRDAVRPEEPLVTHRPSHAIAEPGQARGKRGWAGRWRPIYWIR